MPPQRNKKATTSTRKMNKAPMPAPGPSEPHYDRIANSGSDSDSSHEESNCSVASSLENVNGNRVERQGHTVVPSLDTDNAMDFVDDAVWPGHLGTVEDGMSLTAGDFRKLGIHDQWARMKEIHDAAWTVPDDLHDQDSEEDLDIHLEDHRDLIDNDIDDDDFSDYGDIDWDQLHSFGENDHLSASEQVRAGYFEEFSNIQNKLAAYDLSICRAFSYKVQTHTTDRNFKKLPYAFPTETPLPSLKSIRSRVVTLLQTEPGTHFVGLNLLTQRIIKNKRVLS
ncbi:hypothetical protein K435DRAFT_813955 [Dendrothele bispora CBS 962.96]|uniref:Uncharacterized protein n=1 Tax=Dendrothele bispora (strain CBS 962.96) TaxID=1314807 RepID=A0A4S8KK28_DENBC|nr:hypothetical protein K435DRAFT_813955 [Dendrothele bispora CBS 962.96]